MNATGAESIAVVTDSTACLSELDVLNAGVTVVPLTVVVDESPVDESALTAAALVAALRERHVVTTTSPSPRRFASAYAAAVSAGATQILSLHLSGALSGTVGAAEIAARDASVPVHVVDTRLIGMGLGFLVLQAVELARQGESPEEIVRQVTRDAGLTTTFFYVATLEHLRRGGRIGTAQALLGAALSVKPLLALEDGTIGVVEKVRTSSRAIARLADLAVSSSGDGQVNVAVQHLDDADGARQLAVELRRRLPEATVVVREVGAVVGAHVGPGLLALAVAPRTRHIGRL